MYCFRLKDILPLRLSLLVGMTTSVTASPLGRGPPRPYYQTRSEEYACGEVNIIFTGLPAFHPILVNQGLDPVQINNSIRADTDYILNLGYNIRVVLMGPEVPISHLTDQIHAPDPQGREIDWTGTGVGFGVRGSNREDVTVRFAEIIETYHAEIPRAPTVFDYDPNSASWAIESRFPFIGGGCTNTPGKDLGFNVYCDIC